MKLSLFLIGALAAVAQGANAAMDAEEASEKLQQDEYERNLEDSVFFEQKYTIVTQNENIIFVTPKPLFAFDDELPGRSLLNGQSDLSLLGSKIITRGVVLRPDTVVLTQSGTENVDFLDLFAGGEQPQNTDPKGNKNFFLSGSCTTISQFDDERSSSNDGILRRNLQVFDDVVKFLPTIRSHQCIYDLCLGGKGFNCVGLYGGGGFIFNPLKRIDQSKGANDEDQSIIDDNNREPPLPPPFDLVIFGGTGAFRNVSGKAELMTIAGRNRRGLGVIVQNLMTYTNIPLPVGK